VPPPRDPTVRERVEVVRATLARAEALGLAGKYDAGMAAASEATDAAARLGYAPLHAEALLQRGWLEDKQGDPAAAEVTLSAAAWAAERARHDAVAARATGELVYVVGSQLQRIDEGLQWARHADAAAGRLGDPLALARLLNNRALVLTSAGRYAEAEVDVRRALDLRERLLPPDHPDIATTRTNLGVVLDDLGRIDEALAIYDRVLAEREQALGPEHPRVAALLTNSSQLLAARGQPELALPRIRRAIAIYEAALGPHHPELASAYNNLATVAFAQEDYDGALQAMGQALAIWERVRTPDHPDLGDACFNMGALSFKQDRWVPAREHFERALAIYEAAYGPDHPDVGSTLLNLGIIDQNEGRFEPARERHRRAIEILRAVVPADHPQLAHGLSTLARDDLALARWAEAKAAAEESLRIYSSRDDVEPRLAVEARFLLAQARWGAGGERAAALAEGRAALVQADDELRTEIVQWLADVGEPVPPT
jgi:tetratricopeptide (TPR) repeat protein